MNTPIDMISKTYNRLTVLELLGSRWMIQPRGRNETNVAKDFGVAFRRLSRNTHSWLRYFRRYGDGGGQIHICWGEAGSEQTTRLCHV